MAEVDTGRQTSNDACHMAWSRWPTMHSLCSPVEGGRVSAST